MLRFQPRLSRLPTPRRHASTLASSTAPSGLRIGLYASALAVSTGLFAAYYLDCRSAIHRYVITPIIRHTLDAETGHKLAVRVLASGWAPRDTQRDDERLKVEVRRVPCNFRQVSGVHRLSPLPAVGGGDLKSRRAGGWVRQTWGSCRR